MTAKRPAAGDVRPPADALSDRYARGSDPFVFLLRLARERGIDVLRADLRDITTVAMREQDRWRIYLNRDDRERRQCLSLAHALGHVFLPGVKRSAFVDGGLVTDAMDQSEEREARTFAAALLMPAHVIRDSLGDGDLTAERVCLLAEEFQVSPLALAQRLRDLGYAVPAPTTVRR